MTNNQLKAFIDRLEKLEEEKAVIEARLRDSNNNLLRDIELLKQKNSTLQQALVSEKEKNESVYLREKHIR